VCPAKLVVDDRKIELVRTIRSRHQTQKGKKQSDVMADYMRRVKGWKVRTVMRNHVPLLWHKRARSPAREGV
jgi:hypothetical protein